VVGGSYAGLGAALNLLDLCAGRFPRFTVNPEGEHGNRKVAIEITIVDERDGYCKNNDLGLSRSKVRLTDHSAQFI